MRIRSSRRTVCTCFMAECKLGAYRKQIPISRRHLAASSGDSWTFTPRASITPAEPHFELMLRLPCLATRTPAPAATNAVAVEMLNVPLASPPVPLVSTKDDSARNDSTKASRPVPLTSSASEARLVWVRGSMGKGAAAARIASAKPTISSTVSPFMCKATSNAEICASVHFAESTSVITSRASCRLSDWP